MRVRPRIIKIFSMTSLCLLFLTCLALAGTLLPSPQQGTVEEKKGEEKKKRKKEEVKWEEGRDEYFLSAPVLSNYMHSSHLISTTVLWDVSTIIHNKLRPRALYNLPEATQLVSGEPRIPSLTVFHVSVSFPMTLSLMGQRGSKIISPPPHPDLCLNRHSFKMAGYS